MSSTGYIYYAPSAALTISSASATAAVPLVNRGCRPNFDFLDPARLPPTPLISPFPPPALTPPCPYLPFSPPCPYLPHRLQLASKDPSGVIREAILEEASEEAQQAYTDAQSRAKDVEMLVR